MSPHTLTNEWIVNTNARVFHNNEIHNNERTPLHVVLSGTCITTCYMNYFLLHVTLFVTCNTPVVLPIFLFQMVFANSVSVAIIAVH